VAKIIVLRGVHRESETMKETRVLPIEELRRRILKLQVRGLLFRYEEARLLTNRLDGLTKPFNSALILCLLSRGPCFFEDEEGTLLKIDLRRLASLALRMMRDLLEKRRLLAGAAKEVRQLALTRISSSKKNPLDLKARPVYLRTDLIFGLQSGGSVGHIAGVLNNLDRFTGPSLFFTTDKIQTVRDDIETHIIRPNGRFADFKELPGIHFNEVCGEEIKKHLRGKKVVFVYQRYSLNNYVGARLSSHLGVPLVMEYNGSEIWMSQNWGRPLKYRTLAEEIELINLKLADLIVVVSKAMKDELISRGIDPDKILVNPNGVDPDRYSPDVDGSRIRAQYHLDGRTVLGFIGTFGKWHGAEVLAEAFGRLLQEFPGYRERVRLLMIGDGIMMPQVKAHLQRSGALEAATLTGLVPQEQGPAYLAASDILVASHVPNPDGTPFFGSPTKLFEYMAMGKGIVASDLDQIGEVLKHDYSALLVKPGDAQSLMFGLKALIDDQPRRERLGRAAHQEVVLRYTWKEHTRKIIEKLKERCS